MKKAAVIGFPVKHSWSPIIHNYWIKEHGIFGEYENWRRVRDFEGLGGWVHYTLLSGIRFVLVKNELLEMRLLPSMDAQVIAKIPQHNIATLDKCTDDWCRITDDGYKGWVPKSGIWGVYDSEVKE